MSEGSSTINNYLQMFKKLVPSLQVNWAICTHTDQIVVNNIL